MSELHVVFSYLFLVSPTMVEDSSPSSRAVMIYMYINFASVTPCNQALFMHYNSTTALAISALGDLQYVVLPRRPVDVNGFAIRAKDVAPPPPPKKGVEYTPSHTPLFFFKENVDDAVWLKHTLSTLWGTRVRSQSCGE